MNVAVIGASNKSHRYSYQAVMLLKEKGHHVYPVHPKIKEIDGEKVYASVREIDAPIDTITLYVNRDLSDMIAADLLSRNPGRIIFNPGAENPDLEKKAADKGIVVLNACTLVMLRTGRF